jgi:hypothetical protein
MTEAAPRSTNPLTIAALIALIAIALLFLPLGIVFIEETMIGSHRTEELLRMIGVHHALGEVYKALGIIG